MVMAPGRRMRLTLQGELFGQLGGDIHAVLQPGQLWLRDAVGMAAQARRHPRLPGLALRVHPDDGGDWRGRERRKEEGEGERRLLISKDLRRALSNEKFSFREDAKPI